MPTPPEALPILPSRGGVLLPLLIQPRASRDRLVGIHDDRLKIQLKAPPVDGAANDALVRFIAKLIGCPRADIELVRGASSRRKTLLIHHVPEETMRARLATALS